MALTLDPATEARIQRELARGHYSAPDEVINRALDLLDSEAQANDWLHHNREAINDRLDISFAQAERGESYSPEEALKILSERRLARASLA
jgi:Arc/MetJ-type ribon-helix-helix transcriptional regulator